MYRVSTKISKEKFERMLSGNKSYVLRKIKRAIGESKHHKILHKKSVRQDEAIEAMEYLIKEGLISKSRNPFRQYDKVNIEQQKEEKKAKEKKEQTEEEKKAKKKAEEEAEKQKHIKANIRIDFDEEVGAMERGEILLEHDPRSALGGSVIDKLNEEDEKRNKKVRAEKTKRDKLINPGKTSNKKPTLVDLPDMNID